MNPLNWRHLPPKETELDYLTHRYTARRNHQTVRTHVVRYNGRRGGLWGIRGEHIDHKDGDARRSWSRGVATSDYKKVFAESRTMRKELEALVLEGKKPPSFEEREGFREGDGKIFWKRGKRRIRKWWMKDGSGATVLDLEVEEGVKYCPTFKKKVMHLRGIEQVIVYYPAAGDRDKEIAIAHLLLRKHRMRP